MVKRKPTTAPDGYRLDSVGDLRCEPGSATLPTLCEWHTDHHWCDACEGFYGIPHDLRGCHTMQRREGVILPGSTRPQPGQCACRWCKTWAKLGYERASALIHPRSKT